MSGKDCNRNAGATARTRRSRSAWAQIVLGELQEEGAGVPVKLQSSSEWYRLAAQNGYDFALLVTGADGLPNDPAKSEKWLAIAAWNGHKDAEAAVSCRDVSTRRSRD